MPQIRIGRKSLEGEIISRFGTNVHREDHGRSVNKKDGLAEIQRVSVLFYRCGASMVVDSDSCEPIFFCPSLTRNLVF